MKTILILLMFQVFTYTAVVQAKIVHNQSTTLYADAVLKVKPVDTLKLTDPQTSGSATSSPSVELIGCFILFLFVSLGLGSLGRDSYY